MIRRGNIREQCTRSGLEYGTAQAIQRIHQEKDPDMLRGREAEKDTRPAEYGDQHDDFTAEDIGNVSAIEADQHACQ
ncbi:hypothetical protein D3C75_1161000 [compost metagenome]